MTPAELAAIEARANAASRAPWVPVDEGIGWGITNTIEDEFGAVHQADDLQPDELFSEKDANFIAMARTDVPALVAEVKRLQALLVEARGYADGCPWCGYEGDGRGNDGVMRHGADCPAFHVDGTVR